MSFRTRFPALLATAGGVLVAALAADAATVMHVHLVKSEPAANDTLRAAPTAIKLWFTEAPELAVSSEKLAMVRGSDSTGVATSVVRRDASDPKELVADITGALQPGRYVIAWKTTAPDGHPASGTIPFVFANAGRTGH